jgi:Fur family ferric uptake transcriptional regulator
VTDHPSQGARTGVSDIDEALAIVRSRGGRITTTRRLLLEALFNERGHLTADELANLVRRQAPTIHISTIYRSLEDLEQLGLVVHTHVGHGPTAYHLASHISSLAHGHFLCEECGSVSEVPSTFFKELSAGALIQFGFKIDIHHLALVGKCRNCA